MAVKHKFQRFSPEGVHLIAHLLIFPLDFLRVMCIIELSGTLVPDRRKVQYEKQERGAYAPHPGVHRKLL